MVHTPGNEHMAARKFNPGAAFFGLLILLALAFLGYGVYQWWAGNTPSVTLPQDSPAASSSELIVSEAAKPVPDTAFTDAKGSSHRLADYKGRYVLVNFWATWCGPCKVELPALQALKAKLGGDRLAVVTISLDRDPAQAVAYLADKGLTGLDSFADPDLALASAVGANELPTTLLIDPESNIVGRHTGGAEWDSPEAVAALQKIIKTS
jgi:thiol-disulfide isomerase/thioredoxin